VRLLFQFSTYKNATNLHVKALIFMGTPIIIGGIIKIHHRSRLQKKELFMRKRIILESGLWSTSIVEYLNIYGIVSPYIRDLACTPITT